MKLNIGVALRPILFGADLKSEWPLLCTFLGLRLSKVRHEYWGWRANGAESDGLNRERSIWWGVRRRPQWLRHWLQIRDTNAESHPATCRR